MSIALNELTVQNSITTGEKFIVAGTSSEVQVDYSTLAKAIIEQWNGSNLGGSNRTLKSIIDEINGSYVPYKASSPIMIQQNTDLNTLTTTGIYYCNTTNIASTLTNCPVNVTFRLNVYAIGVRDSGTYAYIIQEIMPYNSTTVYRRQCATGSTADVWTFGKWETDLGVTVDSFGTGGWQNVENSYFTNSASKVFKQGGWAMVKVDGTINSAPSGWQSIGKVEKAIETVATNALTNSGTVVGLRVTTNGALQMAYSGTVPAVIGTTFFYPMQVT